MEGIRLGGTYGAYREAAADDVISDDDGNSVSVKAKDRVFVSFVSSPNYSSLLILLYAKAPLTKDPPQASAGKDAKTFPQPEEVNPRRPLNSYVTYVLGPHTHLAQNTCQTALTEMFRSIFRLKNLRRAPGPQGELKKVRSDEGFDLYMREDHGAYYTFPTTMTICYDI